MDVFARKSRQVSTLSYSELQSTTVIIHRTLNEALQNDIIKVSHYRLACDVHVLKEVKVTLGRQQRSIGA